MNMREVKKKGIMEYHNCHGCDLTIAPQAKQGAGTPAVARPVNSFPQFLHL